MSRLYLRCAICNRQQAAGLISGAGWGRLELPTSTQVEHPALDGSTLRACPTCVRVNPDWHDRIFSVLGLAPGFGPSRPESAQ